MIVTKSLCRYYDGDTQVAAVRGVTFNVDAGERISIVGRSGTGLYGGFLVAPLCPSWSRRLNLG